MPYKNKEDQVKYVKRWRAKHLSIGLCVFCNEPYLHDSNIRLCQKHNEESRLVLKRYYQKNHEFLNARRNKRDERLKKEGKCVNCGIPLTEEDPKVLCVNCGWKKHHPLEGGSYATYLKRIAQRP